MKKIIGIITLSLFLGACNPSGEPLKLYVERYTVVDIPESLYEGCPDIRKERVPYFRTLSETELSAYIVKLYKSNIQCRQAMDRIKDYLKNAKETIEKK